MVEDLPVQADAQTLNVYRLLRLRKNWHLRAVSGLLKADDVISVYIRLRNGSSSTRAFIAV